MTDPTPPPLVSAGDEITVAEADYCYGVGMLRMRITGVKTRDLAIRGLEWVQLEGIEIMRGGREGRPRFALVRVTALRQHGAVRREATEARPASDTR